MNRHAKWLSLVLTFFLLIFTMMTHGSASASSQSTSGVHITASPVLEHTSLKRSAFKTAIRTNHIFTQNDMRADVLRLHEHRILTHPRAHSTKPRLSVKRREVVISHVVQSGDTLWDIAQKNRTTVGTIMTLNHLSSSLIHPGQKLHVKVGFIQRIATIHTTQFTVHGVPAGLLPVYRAAGKKYGIPWTILAAIHRTETRYCTGPIVSPAGAEGPMQFMPATFEYYAVKAPGQSGPPNINNVDDAIYTCAHMLRANGFTDNPTYALYCYNHSFSYVATVRSYAGHL